jgi:hypothetical protein
MLLTAGRSGDLGGREHENGTAPDEESCKERDKDAQLRFH